MTNQRMNMIENIEDQDLMDVCAKRIIAQLDRNIQQSTQHEALMSKLILMRTYIKTELISKPLVSLEEA